MILGFMSNIHYWTPGDPAWTEVSPLNVGVSYVALSFGGPWQWDQDLSGYMNWLFGSHSLWWITSLSLDTGGRCLVLPQLDIGDFVDSSSKVWIVGEMGRGGRAREGEAGELGLVCKILKKLNKKIKVYATKIKRIYLCKATRISVIIFWGI